MTPSSLTVLNIGEGGPIPRGTARVIQEMLAWNLPNVTVRATTTTGGPHDPFAAAKSVRAGLALLRFALRKRDSHAVVAVHLSTGGSFVREGALLVAADLLGLPTVAHLHGAAFEDFARRRTTLVRLVLNRARAVAVLTDRTEEVCRALLDRRVIVEKVRNGIRLPPPSLAGKRNWILFGGELGRRKGVDVLLDAWRQLHKQFPDWELHLAGPLTNEIDKTALGLERLRYHGSIPHKDLERLMQTSRVAVLPSRDEALPMFLIEAMAAANAVVGTGVGQVRELINAECGLVLEPGDAEALRDALEFLCSSPELTRRMAIEARRRIEYEYSDGAVQQGVIDVWSSVSRPHRG